MFSLFNFSSIFSSGGQLTPFAPMCGRPGGQKQRSAPSSDFLGGEERKYTVLENKMICSGVTNAETEKLTTEIANVCCDRLLLAHLRNSVILIFVFVCQKNILVKLFCASSDAHGATSISAVLGNATVPTVKAVTRIYFRGVLVA